VSDIARPYPPGKELAVTTSTLTVVAVSGKEQATVVNGNLGHDYQDGRTK
jgi:hypothetical protein